MSSDRNAVYDPEELSVLARVFEQSVATLPPTMQTAANRTEIAKIILERAAAGEPLAPLMTFTLGAAPLIREPPAPHSNLIRTCAAKTLDLPARSVVEADCRRSRRYLPGMVPTKLVLDAAK